MSKIFDRLKQESRPVTPVANHTPPPPAGDEDLSALVGELVRGAEQRAKELDNLRLQLDQQQQLAPEPAAAPEPAPETSAPRAGNRNRRAATPTAKRQTLAGDDHLRQELQTLKKEAARLTREAERAARGRLQAEQEAEKARQHHREALQEGAAQKHTLELQVERLAKALEQRTTAVEDLRRAAATGTAEQDRQIKALSTEQQALQARIQSMQQEALQATQLLEAAQRELDRQKQLRLESKALEAENAQLAEQTKALATEHAALAQKADATQRDLEGARQELARVETDSRAAIAKAEAERAEVRTILQEREAEASEANTRWNEAKAALESLQAELDRQRTTAAQQAAHIEELEEQIRATPPPAPIPEPAPTTPPQPVAPRTPDDNAWYLKLDDGTLFGPTSEETLYQWACLCRIGPDHTLSHDRQTWVTAREIPALRMNWTVELADGGSYGPINIFAVPALVADGSVTPDARLTSQAGLICKAGDAAIAEGLEAREIARRQQQEIQQLRLEIDALRRATATAQPPIPPKLLREALISRRAAVKAP
jgi:hypothetical protein